MRILLLFLFFLFLTQSANTQANTTQNCQQKFYIKTYGITDKEIVNLDLAALSDNSTIAVGEVRNRDPENYTDGFLIKTKSDGTKAWEKILGGPGTQLVNKIITLKDGNLAIAGVERNGSDLSFYISKLDADGNFFWKKSYAFTHSQSLAITDIKEDVDGSIYLLAYYLENNLSFKDDLLFVRFNSAGEIQYSRIYIPPVTVRKLFGQSFFIKDGYSYIAGHYLHDDKFKGLLLKINNTSATHQWTKVFDLNGGDANFEKILPYGNDALCLLGRDNINTTDTSLLMVCDLNGNLRTSRFLYLAGKREYGKAVIDNNNYINWIRFYYREGNADKTNLHIIRLHIDSGIVFSNNYNQLQQMPRTMQTVFSPDSSLFFSGYHTGRNGSMMQFYIGKASNEGLLGCTPEDAPFVYSLATTKVEEVIFSLYDVSLPPTTTNWQIVTNIIDKEDYLCNFLNQCTFLKLSASKIKVCNTSDTIIVNIEKDANCLSSPVLIYDKTVLRLVTKQGSVAKFFAIAYGSTTITARINNGCQSFEDAKTIEIFISPAKLDLGTDTVLCKSNVLQLNARKGFVSYKWQDGSTDSILTVVTPGFYTVQAVNACNESFFDAIEVKEAQPILFNLGPDLNKCNNDTVTLSMPPGFLNYNWTPKTEIKNDIGQAVLFPKQTTQYKVVAEKTPGCFAEDSIVVFVNQSLSINLGKDTSFCAGDSVILNAGNNFLSYKWNSGSTTQEIKVKTKGSYSVSAMDSKGCVSRDTLHVVNVFSNPVVDLGKDDALCHGQPRTLDAGEGFKTYAWSNGSANPKILINDLGTYSVKVQDKNECHTSDTIIVSKAIRPPSNFLPADTSLCTYATLTLTAKNSYSTYLWSTGSKASEIEIDKAGIYRLNVTDRNGCTGVDSVIISPEQCMKGFYIPNAFTPNNDSRNDIFRPLIFGNIKWFRFTILNRWGEKVFESSRPGDGWNGKNAAMEDKTSVFVWTCEYQLENEQKKYEKGTVTLIR